MGGGGAAGLGGISAHFARHHRLSDLLAVM